MSFRQLTLVHTVMSGKTPLLAILLAVSFLLPKAEGATVIFTSPITTGETSGSVPWPTDGSFHFEVGTFDAGFTPLLTNVDSWLPNWNLADMGDTGQTTWLDDSGDLYFLGTGDYTTNAGSWVIGNAIYIWGYNTRAPGANQWILFGNAAWQTVAHDSIPSQIFSTDDVGSVTVVGSMDGGGGTFVSANVVLVPEPSTSVLLGTVAILALLARIFKGAKLFPVSRKKGQSVA